MLSCSLNRIFASLAAAGLIAAPSALHAQDAEWEYEPGEGLHQEEWYDPSDWFNDDENPGVDYEADDWDWDYSGYGDYDSVYGYDANTGDDQYGDTAYDGNDTDYVYLYVFDTDRQPQGQMQTLRGTVAATTTAQVPRFNQTHLLARIRTDRGQFRNVDLGPAQRVQGQIREGQQIQLRGEQARGNGQPVFRAAQARMNGQTIQINRDHEQWQQVQYRQPGQQQQQQFQRQAQQRQQQRAQNQARQQQRSDQTYGFAEPSQQRQQRMQQQIERRRDQMQQHWGQQQERQRGQQSGQQSWRQRGQQQQSIRGEVIRTGRATLQGSNQERLVAEVQTRQGQQILVDLGPLDEARREVRQGEQIQASGQLSHRSGQQVLLADRFRTQGQQQSQQVQQQQQRTGSYEDVEVLQEPRWSSGQQGSQQQNR